MKSIAVWMTTAGLLAWSLSACGKSNAESPKKESPAGTAATAYVKTETVRLTEFVETIHLTGTVESAHDVIVPAEETGRLIEWFVPKGAVVSKGQALAQIDDVLLQAASDAAKAAYDMAQVNYTKQQKAYEEQAVSELQLKNLEYQRDGALAQWNLARARLARTKIVSPIDGVVNDRLVDAGEMIVAGAPAAQVVDVRSLKIVVGVPERYARDLAVGRPVTVTVDAYPGDTLGASIGFVAPSVNPDNRTIPTEIYLTNGKPALKPNMIARVTLALRTGMKAVVIAQDYLQQLDRDRLVVYVAHNGAAEERSVRVGGSDGTQVRILEGLNEGDELIIVGFQNLVNHQAIQIKN